MTFGKVLLVVALSGSVFGQSEKEKALQAQLDAAHDALAASTRASDQLVMALEKANANASAARVATTHGKVDGTISSAAADAAADAATAQIIMTANGAAARKAAEEAAALVQGVALTAQGAAATARAQNVALMITQAFGFLAVLVGLLWKGYSEARDRRWALEDVRDHQKDVIEKLGQVKDEAHAAYTEANTVNLKIASIGMQMKDGRPPDADEKTSGAGGGTA
jgi:hypothetical protein